ncbi:MAG: RecX family transcriptional regulator [Anaerolineaceae bacterium]|nr:RecX family transcriptional regulator [Anaerolineaceae bacterium]
MSNKISAITAQKRNPNRVNIYIDGSYRFSLSRIVAAWLKVGEILDDIKIEKLQSHDEYEIAFQRAARYLQYRARTTYELNKKLLDLGFSDEVVENVIRRCNELQMLNDEDFAASYVHFRITHRPRGRRLLVHELKSKGIKDEIIQSALSDITDESQLAYDTAKRYIRRVQALPYDQFQKKLIGYLNRRGFAYQECRQTVRLVWDELHAEEKHPLNLITEGDDV